MKARYIVGGLTMLALSGLTVLPPAQAQTGTIDLSLKKCGGQNSYRPTPAKCYNERTIDGVQMRVQVYVATDGSWLVEFHRLNNPDILVGLQVRAHVGFSFGPGTREVSGTMTPGETFQTLTGVFPKPCQASIDAQAHQLDVKFENGTPNPTGHRPARFRVSGATYVFAPCMDINTIAPPSTTPSPGTPTQPTAPSTPTGGGGASSQALPETGEPVWGAVYIAVVLVLGGATVLLYRKPRYAR